MSQTTFDFELDGRLAKSTDFKDQGHQNIGGYCHGFAELRAPVLPPGWGWGTFLAIIVGD